MRDPKRIKRMLDALEHYWNRYPDLRLGQIVGNSASRSRSGGGWRLNAATKTRLKREAKYARKYFFAWDFAFGVSAGVSAFYLLHTDDDLHKALVGSIRILTVTGALGLAILAVVIASVSILTAFFTEDYGVILRATFPDDPGEVFYPYRVIALVSCATTFVSFAGIFLWPTLSDGLREPFLATAVGLATWSTLGVYDLVRQTVGHGRMKMRMPELDPVFVEELKVFLEERREKKAA